MLNPTLAIAFIVVFAITIGNVFTIFVFQSQCGFHLKILKEFNSFFCSLNYNFVLGIMIFSGLPVN